MDTTCSANAPHPDACGRRGDAFLCYLHQRDRCRYGLDYQGASELASLELMTRMTADEAFDSLRLQSFILSMPLTILRGHLKDAPQLLLQVICFLLQ